MNNNKTYKKIVFMLTLACIGGGIGFYYIHNRAQTSCINQDQPPFYIYDEARDRQDITNMFITDRWWLLSSDDYDVDFMLTYKAPNENPLYVGKLNIRVMRVDGEFVGFTAFYKKTLTEGALLFLAIHEKFRNKGYAKKLAQYAIDTMACMGATKISLVTRSQNVRAQAVYNKLGFTVTSREEGYVYYGKTLTK